MHAHTHMHDEAGLQRVSRCSAAAGSSTTPQEPDPRNWALLPPSPLSGTQLPRLLLCSTLSLHPRMKHLLIAIIKWSSPKSISISQPFLLPLAQAGGCICSSLNTTCTHTSQLLLCCPICPTVASSLPHLPNTYPSFQSPTGRTHSVSSVIVLLCLFENRNSD